MAPRLQSLRPQVNTHILFCSLHFCLSLFDSTIRVEIVSSLMASMWATEPLKSKEISPSAASRWTSPAVPHLQKPWTGKQYIMEGGKMESSQNIHQGLLYGNCEHPSLCRLCCGASAVAQIKKACSSPLFPLTRLAFLTARRAWICCWWRPCQRTLNIYVCACACVWTHVYMGVGRNM